MSRLFPHAPFAEDQPLAHTILTTHVLTRAVTAGSIASIGITSVYHIIPRLRTSVKGTPFTQRLLVSAGTSSLVAMGLTAVATALRMRGRDTIEWQDRSWRLLENPGQLETDDWTYAGMGVGAAALAASRGLRRATGWRGVVGAAGLGSVGGTLGYLAWRYGMNGGKFDVKEAVL
ncbi:hypothetical protein S40285_01708 [Stachybotrys chlorohalonatus IBT 40285]|uniref:Uncharacterized protein n=1 Tax=Stachybotrys chlorohalonatus (strain IBT 40285) TaxID=1283841 RepID=A0A084QDS9_STAC4|nr:hypothetical protein S40285_01708 [Stachybotrys chlorohalonata IBT 40285]